MMSCLSKILVVLMTLFPILALGCFQELERPSRMTETGTPTATPIVIVKYIEQPTTISSGIATMTPTMTPTMAPTMAPPVTRVNPANSAEWLKIIAPEDGVIVRDNILVIQGIGNPRSKVTVNGDPVMIDENGRFWKGIMLKTGANDIKFVVKSENEVKATATRYVTLLSRQPIFLSVREPLNQSLAVKQTITVAGLTTPDARITVQAKEVEVQVRDFPDLPVKELGVFNTEISLSVGTNHIKIIASNGIGQIIRTDLVVAYLP